MRVISYKCDACGGPINTFECIESSRIEVKPGFEFEIKRVNGNIKGWEDQQVCKYCFIDEVNKLDDRNKEVNYES